MGSNHGPPDFEQIPFSQFRKEISYFGLVVDDQGVISHEGDGIPVEEIDRSYLARMKYLGRIQLAKRFFVTTELEKSALACVFRISKKDLALSIKPHEDMLSFHKNMYFSLHQIKSAESVLNSNKIRIIKYQHTYFAVDSRNRHLLELSQFGDVHLPVSVRVIDLEKEFRNRIIIG